MDIDESIQVQNRANNGYNQCYKNYQNNKWDQTKRNVTQNTQQGQTQ